MASTTIQLCGRFAVELEGVRIENELPGRQGRLLVAYLVLNRDRSATRNELIEALWPGELPRDPGDALAAILSKVRVDAREPLPRGTQRARARAAAGTDVDVERALTAAHQAESACAQADWARAWARSLTAQIVARRTLLADYEAAWIDEWRRELDGIRVRSLECYARACLGLGGAELSAAERAARQLVRTAPLRESGYGLLMEALKAQGNAAEALVVYESAPAVSARHTRHVAGRARSGRVPAAARNLSGAKLFPRFPPGLRSPGRAGCPRPQSKGGGHVQQPGRSRSAAS